MDIQAAVGQRAGVGRYTHRLVEHLARQAGDDRLALFYFDFRRRGTGFEVPGAEERAVRWLPGAVATKLWARADWPPFDALAGPADVYHFPNFAIPPVRTGRKVVTIHDVSFVRHPEFTEEKNLAYLTATIPRTLARADAIVTDSRFSAAEITDLLKVDPGRVHAVPLGISPAFRPASPAQVEEARRRLGIGRPYLLTVSTLEPRKNIPFLVEAFERLTAFDGCLVIAGPHGWKHEPILDRIARSPRRDSILNVRFVPDALLPALYTGAELFLFPSHYEGFGFPPLEAMACHTPVISSAGGSLAEVLGDGALIPPAWDADLWAAFATRLLERSAERRALIERGVRTAARYTWDRTAAETWAVYRTLHP